MTLKCIVCKKEDITITLKGNYLVDKISPICDNCREIKKPTELLRELEKNGLS